MGLTAKLSIPAIVAIVAAAAFVLWLVLRDNGKGHKAGPAAAGVPAEFAARAVSPADLAGVARESSTPVYWAGDRTGTKLEATVTAHGRVFVRYLPPNAQIGTRAPYLTVASYPYRNGARALRAVGRSRGGLHRLPHDGVAVASPTNPRSVLFSYGDGQYEVEVYDPTPGRALSLVLAGRLAPVG